MAKSPDAFRTISEVAEWLGVQAHVLRFWESKFAQVKPIKRAGGRRYYRPADMLLLGGLKKVLHEDGLTIKGAQKLLREKGVSYVADLSQPLDDLTIAVIEGSGTAVEDQPVPAAASDTPDTPPEQEPAPQIEIAEDPEVADTPEPEPEPVAALPDAPTVEDDTVEAPAPEASDVQDIDLQEAAAPTETEAPLDAAPDEVPQPEVPDASDMQDAADDQPDLPLEAPEAAADAEDPAPMVTFRARPRPSAPPAAEAETEAEAETATQDAKEAADAPPTDSAPEEAVTPKPDKVDVTLVHDHTLIEVDPSALTTITQINRLAPEHAQEIRPLLARLTRLKAGMANARKELGKD